MPTTTHPHLDLPPKWGSRRLTDDFNTLVSTFQSGAETRRSFWTQAKALVRLNFDLDDYTLSDFYIARKGALNGFLLPTWRRETALTVAASAGASTITVGDVTQFTDTSALRGNWLTLRNFDSSNLEFGRITDITGSVISVDSTLLNSYVIGNFVDVALWVRFQRSAVLENPIAGVFRAPIDFVELPKEIPTTT